MHSDNLQNWILWRDKLFCDFFKFFYYLDCTKCKFPDFSQYSFFSLTFNKIPWQFPDFCQVWNFPDFSLTAGHPVQHLTLFKPKKIKNGGNFYQGCQKNRAQLNFSFCNIMLRFNLILTKIWFSIKWKYFRALALISIDLCSFLPHNL